MQLAQFSWINKAWTTVTSLVSNFFINGRHATTSQSRKQMSQLTKQKQIQVEKIVPQNKFPNPKNNPFSSQKVKKSRVVSIQQVANNKNRYLKNWLQQKEKSKQKLEQTKRINRFFDNDKQSKKNTQTHTSSETKMKDENALRELQFLRKYQQSLQISKIQFLNKSKSQFDRFQIESSQFQESAGNNLYSEGKSPFCKKKQKIQKISFKKYLKSGRTDISPNGLFRDFQGDDISSIQRHTEMIQESQPQIVKFAKIPLTPTKLNKTKKSYSQQKNKSCQKKKIPLQDRHLFIPQTKKSFMNIDPDLKFMIDFKLQQAGLYPQMAYGRNNQIRNQVLAVIQKAIDQFSKYSKRCRQNGFIPIVNSSDSIDFDVNISSDQSQKNIIQSNSKGNLSMNILNELMKQKSFQGLKQSQKFLKQQAQPFKSMVKWEKVIQSNGKSQNYEKENNQFIGDSSQVQFNQQQKKQKQRQKVKRNSKLTNKNLVFQRKNSKQNENYCQNLDQSFNYKDDMKSYNNLQKNPEKVGRKRRHF